MFFVGDLSSKVCRRRFIAYSCWYFCG